jgi:phage antirepressor YoqD-like protein
MKNSNTRRETIPYKEQENNLLSINPKEDRHTNIILPLITKVTGKQQLLFLNIS